MQTSNFLMRNITQDTPKYLGSGRVSQNSQSQTQTRVFSKDEEKNLHFLALIFPAKTGRRRLRAGKLWNKIPGLFTQNSPKSLIFSIIWYKNGGNKAAQWLIRRSFKLKAWEEEEVINLDRKCSCMWPISMFACCLRSLSISLHDDHPQSRAHCFCLPVFVYLPDCLSLLPVLPHLYSAYALVSLF